MESSECTSRRSERKRKRKESYSPEGKKEGVKKNKDGQKSQSKPKSSNRLYDVLPNGEPFSCHLCKSPYVVNPVSKGVKKAGRSRHTPLPKVRTDRHTGKEMMLCNACVQIFDRPQRRAVKAASIPTEEEKTKYQEDIDNFIKLLKSQFADSLVERLFCPVSQRKLCGCLQRYIESTGISQVPGFVSLMKQAIELRKEKAYPVTEDKKIKFVGLGNGHKKSKSYEEFVLAKRRVLKEDMRLCERATQKILMYSNNFLHKRLKTENRPCRVERTRGKAALGQLPDIHTMMDMYCCNDNCVMMALTHKRLLQSWRDRAQQGQQEARRVMAEMLTPAGATHLNCYTFISMVTGCSQSTISSVFSQMLDTGGIREPPEHGMKKVWQDHYKQTRTSEGTHDARESISVADQLSQETVSSHALANQNTVINLETLSSARQHKLAWIQDLANKQVQQQQLALQLQDLISGGKSRLGQSNLGSSQDGSTQLHDKPGEVNKNHTPVNHLHQIPVTTTMNLNPTVTLNQSQITLGQGLLNGSQGYLPQFMLQPPPQYGIQQDGAEKHINPSQFTFPVNMNTNYLITGDQQVVPVIPVVKQGPEQLVPGNRTATETLNQNDSLPHTPHNFQVELENLHNLTSRSGQNNSSMTNLITSRISNESNQTASGQFSSSVKHSEISRQVQISGNQVIPGVHFQPPVIEHPVNKQVTAEKQTAKTSANSLDTAYGVNNGENINPNIYFQVIPETSLKAKTANSSDIDKVKESSIQIQNRNVELIQQSPRDEQTGQISDGQLTSVSYIQQSLMKDKRDTVTDTSEGRPSNSFLPYSSTQQTNVGGVASNLHANTISVLAGGEATENNSTMVLSNFPNQADLAYQPVNQTQLILPVSFLPGSQSNEGSGLQIPSQIQISFQTCSAENNQQNITQQILLPHGEVVTLPMMPVTIGNDLAFQNTQTTENSSVHETNVVSNVFTESITPPNLSQENLKLHLLNQKDHQNKPQKSAVKSRNSSGNSRKSRNTSGASEQSRKSVVQFSNTVRKESSVEHGSTANLEQLSESQFVSKLNKTRHRQFSGNSEHGERSRKSSGNSLISETSSHASGLTLSNLASPNIFHDKDKGIFFIQSMDGLELSEIDSSHIVDFIQAVEADQTGPLEVQTTNQNQSVKLDANVDLAFVNQSGLLEAESKIEHCRTVESNGNTIQSVESLTLSNSDSKRPSHFAENTNTLSSEYTGIGIVQIQSQNHQKSQQKGKRSTNKKCSTKSNQSKANIKNESKNKSENQSAALLTKNSKNRFDGIVSTAGFVPIAPKVSHQLWNIGSTVSYSNNTVAQSTPVLSSLLAKKPLVATKKIFTPSVI